MRIKATLFTFSPIVVALAVVAGLFWAKLPAQSPDINSSPEGANPPLTASSAQSQSANGFDTELSERLKAICDRAGGEVGVAVIHVETARSIAIQGERQLPLYSVFKLPLAVSILKEVEENRLRLDQVVRVTPAEVAPGSKANSDLWRKPVERTVAELLELSILRSDNTSSDKLLQLLGGAAAVTRQMRALDLQSIDIRSSVREFATQREHPNKGAASDLAQLLARLQRGEVLQPPQLRLLVGFMERATTGLRRLRGDLPPGTRVADKSGTGGAGSATNDVGLITLPEGMGHLAMAVLISGSKLSVEAQERLIAEVARAAYDAHVSRAAQGTQ
jgi:beta-lactamase class A